MYERGVTIGWAMLENSQCAFSGFDREITPPPPPTTGRNLKCNAVFQKLPITRHCIEKQAFWLQIQAEKMTKNKSDVTGNFIVGIFFKGVKWAGEH